MAFLDYMNTIPTSSDSNINSISSLQTIFNLILEIMEECQSLNNKLERDRMMHPILIVLDLLLEEGYISELMTYDSK